MLRLCAIFCFITSCIPIFSGEGEEVKSMQPGANVGGVAVGGMSFVTIEKAYPERVFVGRLIKNQGERQVPIRYVRVCLLDNVKNEVACGTSDEMGNYRLGSRMPAGSYTLAVQGASLAKERSLKIDAEKEFTIDFTYGR